MHSTLRSPLAVGAAVAIALLTTACAPDAPTATGTDAATPASAARAGYDQPGVHVQYGTPVKLGDGRARTYVVLAAKAHQAPLEIGIALDARALDGLPTGPGEFSYLLALPTHAPAPYQFAELDWNPQGHPPVGIYTVPHFDFHFYTISRDEWNSIVPTDPVVYAERANDLPTGGYVPPGYFVPGPPALVAVPNMGVHWLNALAPELHGQPFTETFIYGSWNGRYTFYEPMITRAFLLSHPDVTTPIPVPQLYPLAGWYPTSYRVTYDAQAKEYRVALTGLVART